MLRNYLKIAWRNIRKNGSYTFINVLGLSIGLTLCLLISLWVRDELAYDRFHQDSDQIYRGLWQARYGDNDWKIPIVPMPLGTTLQNEFPEVAAVTQFSKGRMTLKKDRDFVREPDVLFVDSSFLDVFTVEVLEGVAAAQLLSPNTLIITERAAKKYFTGGSAVGKTITQNDGKVWEVSAVVKAFPAQSHLQFDMLASIANVKRLERRKEQWGSASVYTYFKVRPGTDMEALQSKLQTYVDGQLGDSYSGEGDYSSFPFQPLTSIHLDSNLEYELSANGNRNYVYLFVIVAFMILLLAGVNFINLATAYSITRAKEVGIRKVLGSKRDQISGQFFVETLLQVCISVLVALILAQLIMPYFNQLAGKSLSIGQVPLLTLFSASTILVLSLTLLTGTLPAKFLSAIDVVKVLKGATITKTGRNWVREGLVVSQFCISTGLIVGMFVVQHQLDFIQNQRLGFDKEQVLVINRASGLERQYEPFLNELNAMAGVEQTACGQSFPGKAFDSTIFLPEQPANYRETSLNYAFVGAHYADLLELEFISGRNFSPDMISDSTACLINETAADRLGWTDPIGKTFNRGNDDKRTVIGVVKDFHYRSSHHEVEPLILFMTSWQPSYMAVKLSGKNMTERVAAIENQWKQMAPKVPFDFTFLDEDYAQLYANEQKMAEVFTIFAGLALFIACLGLFGLASFLIKRRSKEIAIRKVVGATTAGIMGLLSRDFLRLVLIGILIAVPIAWYAMNSWLQDFAYRIDIQWWIFALAGSIAIVVALAAVAFQSITAAMANPVTRLRDF